MSPIRPFQAHDIPALVALRPAAFRSSLQPSPQALAEYFERIFVRSPWSDPAIPSLVFEDDQGRSRGFLGVLVRRMRLGERDLKVAIPTQFMVHTDSRGVAGIQLMRRFLAGAQDLAISDRGNDAARKLWERMGGVTSVVHSLFWVCALRPTRFMTREPRSRAAGVAERLIRPLANLLDAAIGALGGPGILKSPPAGTTEALDLHWLVRHFAEFIPPRTLYPLWNEDELRLVLGELEAKTRLGTLRSVLVRDESAQPIGWFVYYVNPGGISHVVQTVARRDCGAAVLGHLLFRAGQDGALAVQGRASPEMLADLGRPAFKLDRRGPWMLVHSREPELSGAVLAGRGFVSRLDSEWWLNF